MDIYFLQYKFHDYFLPLLSVDSNERNHMFKKISLHDIYDLIYLSSGICDRNNVYIINNSLKLLNKYLIYIKQYNVNIHFIHFLEHMYIFLTNYDYLNKNQYEIFEEINHKIYAYNNLENFKYYIDTNPQIIDYLLCNLKSSSC